MAASESIQQSISEAENWLAARDSELARLIDRHGPCTIYQRPALYHMTAFHVLAWSIINQQLSVAAARSIERRLLQHHPRDRFQRGVIESLTDQQLAACGLSRQKIRYLRSLCQAIASGQTRLGRIRHMDDQQVAQELIQLPGVGPWTIDMFLMFYLARLDVLPLGDLALRRAITITYGLDDTNDADSMQGLAARWAPYRTVASWYLWCVVD